MSERSKVADFLHLDFDKISKKRNHFEFAFKDENMPLYLPKGTVVSECNKELILPYRKGSRLLFVGSWVVVQTQGGSISFRFGRGWKLKTRQTVKFPGLGRMTVATAQDLINVFYPSR